MYRNTESFKKAVTPVVGLLFALVAPLMIHTQAQAAPIIDEVYGCSWNTSSGGCPLDVPSPSSNWFVSFGPGDTATPGAGVEFSITTGSGTVTLDIGDGTIDISYSCATCGWSGFEFALTGIDSVDITAFDLVSAGGLPFLSSSFTSDTIRASFDPVSPAGTKTASFTYAASVIPEPSTALLLGGGLLGLAASGRRRKA